MDAGADLIIEASNAAADGTSRTMLRRWLHAYHRRLSGEMRYSSGVDQVTASVVPAQMWQRASPVLAQMWQG